MFVKFKTAIAKGDRKAGDVVEIPDAEAKGLIDCDIVEATAAPETVAGTLADVSAQLGKGINEAIIAGFKEITKSVAAGQAQRRSFLEVPGEADAATLDVDSLVRYATLRNFPNDRKGIERAYRFGMYCMGILNDDPASSNEVKYRSMFARQKCVDLHIPLRKGLIEGGVGVTTKTTTEKNNTSAGFLVPDEFQNVLIDLREKYGVFRQNTKIVPMSSDTRSDPRRRGGLTASFVDEVAASSYSDKTWDRVRLTARKLMVLTKYSTEIAEDAVISIGDDLAGEIAYAFANKEDQCGFNGDGTSTYGGMTGLNNAIKNVSATPTSTIADVLGIFQTSHNSYATITLADFNTVVGLLPEFADTPNAKWYCHRTFWGSVMQRLATAAGGNRVSEIQGGAQRKTFLGYDVVVSQVLPKVYAANQIPCFFGDLSLSSRLGDRRETTIAMSDQFAFDTDAIVIRGTERFHIVNHDLGELATQTARDPVMGLTAGPIVALMLT